MRLASASASLNLMARAMVVDENLFQRNLDKLFVSVEALVSTEDSS